MRPKLSDYFRACQELGAFDDDTVTEEQAMARAREIARARKLADLNRDLIARGGQP